MIEGNAIRLRAWRESDLTTLAALRNDYALQAKLLARSRGNSATQVREWVEQISRTAGAVFLIVAATDDDAALGYLKCSGFDVVDRNVELGICLAPDFQGRGIGSMALALAMEYLRSTWDVRKVSLRTRGDNSPAIRCYERNGFQVCGRLLAHVYIEAAWHDIVLMERFLGTETPLVAVEKLD